MPSRRLRIVYLHHSAELYGSDRMLLELASRIDRRHFAPVVFLPRVGPLCDALLKAEIPVKVVPMPVVQRSDLRGLGWLRVLRSSITIRRQLVRELHRQEPHVIHTVSLASLGAAAAASALRVPHLWHVHELVTSPAWASVAFCGLVRVLADVVVCNSQVVFDNLAGRFPQRGKLRLIYNGVAAPVATLEAAAVRNREGWQSGDTVFLLAGHIYPRKGHDVFIEAARSVAARCANAQFVVVGSAPPAYRTYEDEIRARTRQYGLTARVSFLPFQGDLGDIMHAVDVVVVPSTEPESFGLVAVEAMAAGKPVVASAHGGSLETIVHGSNGLLVQPGDGGELARVMERLASSPSERCRLGQYGRQHYSERFGIGRYVDNFEALYSEIAR